MAQQLPSYRAYVAWDLPTRLFHWVNALAVIGLLATGIVILNDDALGFSAEGKVLLKSVHVSFGYVMALNLLWRFVWAFFGNRYARWRAVLPGGPGFIAASKAYVASFLSGEPQQYVGHNPLARIGVALLFLLLLIQVVTGLVLAGTDLFWPPFGRLFAEWIAAPGIDPSTIQPGASDLIEKTAYELDACLPGTVGGDSRGHLLSIGGDCGAPFDCRGGHRSPRRRQHHVSDVHRPEDTHKGAA